uniref:Peptidase_M1_N domain-containing protein n=1 Tax=Panagrellus redivivus TaxID=6233 RepID=A0A7E5A0W9_PANRE
MRTSTVVFLFALFGCALSEWNPLSDIHPITYNLTLDVNLPLVGEDNGNEVTMCDAEVDITAEATAPTRRIFLHAENLDIESTCFHSNGVYTFLNAVHHKDSNLLEIKTPYLLRTGEKFRIAFKHRYPLGLEQKGLYRATFSNFGEIHHYALVQLVPNYARRFVPCFDDEQFPATWNLKVTVPDVYDSFFNTAAISKTRENGIMTSIFESSKPLPPSHLNIIVGDYKASHCKEEQKSEV